MPNKISRFWQELKRRNVVRVITVYAGAAFVILELVDMITEPFGIPVWTFKLAIVVLSIGLIVAIILSWIYDIHPEGGMVKTEPADQIPKEEIKNSSNRWKIASYISFVVIVALILINVIPRSNRDEDFKNLEKSIAVLPFTNMTIEENFDHIGSAFCDEIIMELHKIKSFDRVLSHTSTMQYAENRPTIPEIAEKLNVNYIVEGTIQKHADEVSVRVQVIRANQEDHIWGKEYNGLWEDIYTIQDEIAFKVANELKMALSPEEQERIERIPTSNLTALDFFQRGREEHTKYWLDETNKTALKNAISYYKGALDLDPDYAQAYTSLALGYVNSFLSERDLNKQFSVSESELFRDSILSLVDKALSIDKDLEEAYHVRGLYYWGIQEYDRALREMDKAIAINPNYALVYDDKAGILFYRQGRWIDAFEAKYKAITLERGALLPALLRGLGWFYEDAGFNKKATEIYDQILQLTYDTIMYYEYMAGTAYTNRNWEEHIRFSKKIIEMDPNRYWPYAQLPFSYSNMGNTDSASYYIEKLIGFGENQLSYTGDYDIIVGKYYWESGKRKEAVELLDKAWDYNSFKINNKEGSRDSNLAGLALISYIKGEYEEAMMQLNRMDLTTVKPQWIIILLEAPSAFSELHSDEGFQQILQTMKSKWQAEHEKVAQWLEENDLL